MYITGILLFGLNTIVDFFTLSYNTYYVGKCVFNIHAHYVFCNSFNKVNFIFSYFDLFYFNSVKDIPTNNIENTLIGNVLENNEGTPRGINVFNISTDNSF